MGKGLSQGCAPFFCKIKARKSLFRTEIKSSMGPHVGLGPRMFSYVLGLRFRVQARKLLFRTEKAAWDFTWVYCSGCRV